MGWLVAGLGNPGERYAATRHNVGAMVVHELARAAGERLKKIRFIPVDACEIRVGEERVWLARAHGFMNESGPAYSSLARKRDVEPSRVIAIHDDIDLALGALRLKIGGSTAGHNGLKSLQQALRTPEFLRVRLGVGRPPGRQDPANFVLQSFAEQEEADAAIMLDEAADAVKALITDGLDRAQDRFNRTGPRE